MSIIKWNADLSIGIEDIDDQHRQLINIINELHLAVEYHKGNETIVPILQKLRKYTDAHFEQEEDLLDKLNFPGKAEHVKRHREFLDKLENLEERYGSSSELLTVHVRDFLLTWLFDHIKTYDMAYKQFLAQKKT